MQPKRDPNDVRFWPQSEGGTGFNRDGNPRYQYSALRERDQHRNLVTDHTVTLPSIVVADPQTYTPDTVRSRARAALLLAVERLHDALLREADHAKSLSASEITGIANALGKISGVATTNVEVSGGIAHLHLDALRELTSRGTSLVNAQPVVAQAITPGDAVPVNEGAEG